MNEGDELRDVVDALRKLSELRAEQPSPQRAPKPDCVRCKHRTAKYGSMCTNPVAIGNWPPPAIRLSNWTPIPTSLNKLAERPVTHFPCGLMNMDKHPCTYFEPTWQTRFLQRLKLGRVDHGQPQ